MKILVQTLALLLPLAAGCSASSQAASTPKALASALQGALDKGDFDAARKLADIDDAPAQLHFFFLDTVRECSMESDCSVSTAAADDELRQDLAEQAKSLNAEAPDVEGVITVVAKSKDGSGSGTMKMPYAKVGSGYKLVSIHFSPAQFAAIKAKTDDSLVAEFFAKGIRPGMGAEPRTDWATAASPLPADGGEPGKALIAHAQVMAAAVDAGDPDAAMNSGDQMDKIIFRDKGFKGEPIALAARKSKLYVQSLRMLRDVKVSGGYQLDDDAVLLIEARDGIGWIVRGPVLMSKDSGSWEYAGGNTVSYPADTR
jgi:hypothetical protein